MTLLHLETLLSSQEADLHQTLPRDHLAPVASAFLKRASNKGLVEVTGNRVNRGAGYGLEIPCKYHFYGSTLYIERLKTIVHKLISDGL